MEINRSQNITAPTPALALVGANETCVFTQNEPKCTQFAPLRGALLFIARESEKAVKIKIDCVFLCICHFPKKWGGGGCSSKKLKSLEFQCALLLFGRGRGVKAAVASRSLSFAQETPPRIRGSKRRPDVAPQHSLPRCCV